MLKNKNKKQIKLKLDTLHSSSSSASAFFPFHHVWSFSLTQKKFLTSCSKAFSPAVKSIPFNIV